MKTPHFAVATRLAAFDMALCFSVKCALTVFPEKQCENILMSKMMRRPVEIRFFVALALLMNILVLAWVIFSFHTTMVVQ